MKTCKECGRCAPVSEFSYPSARGIRFRSQCRACFRIANAAAVAASKARRAQGIAPQPRTNPDAWPTPQPFIPPTDFLLMGEPDRSVALVWRVAA